MNALQDAALAPLDVIVIVGYGVFEGSAHEEALHLHGEEGLEDGGRVKGQAVGEGFCGGGSEDL